jgi:rare lipoprotein A
MKDKYNSFYPLSLRERAKVRAAKWRISHFARDITIILSVLVFTACSRLPVKEDGPPPQPVDVSSVPDAVPRAEPLSKYGNPPSYAALGREYQVMTDSKDYVERGIASWYGTKFHGQRTSSGEPYDMYTMTAAHKSLPIPTYVEVTNLVNHKKIIVRVNDRGPFKENRIIDLSYAAASRLNILADGTGLVEIRAIDPLAYNRPPQPASDIVKPDPTGALRLYLQVGAFIDQQNAENLRHRLLDIAPVEINTAEPGEPGRTFYRVRLGPLTTVDEADRLAARLAGMGIDVMRVVID